MYSPARPNAPGFFCSLASISIPANPALHPCVNALTSHQTMGCRISIIWPFLLLFCPLAGQNLIPNPGFERCDGCDANGFMELGIGKGANIPSDWVSASFGSPDIYSSQPRSGKRHGGFFSGFKKFEYLANHFTTPLERGARYRFSFWIKSDRRYPLYALDEFGVFILNGEPIYLQTEPLRQLMPNFVSPDGQFIGPDTYLSLSFEFAACGGEDHFVVGRFKSVEKGDTSFIGAIRPANPSGELFYYIVDDFEMVQIQAPPPGDLLPAQLTMCPDSTKTLRVPDEYAKANIIWSTGATGPETSFTNQALVWVEVRLDDACNTVLRDSVIIDFFPEVNLKILGADSLCTGDTLLLKALCNGDCFDLVWSNQQTGPTAAVTQPGNYSVVAKTACRIIEKSKAISPSLKSLDDLVQFPNVVLRNGQAENQVFRPFISANRQNRLLAMEWAVYNRWGREVFFTRDPSAQWIPSPSEAPTDAYLYRCKATYQDCELPVTRSFKGTFNLID
jgi:hypothetical protein